MRKIQANRRRAIGDSQAMNKWANSNCLASQEDEWEDSRQHGETWAGSGHGRAGRWAGVTDGETSPGWEDGVRALEESDNDA